MKFEWRKNEKQLYLPAQKPQHVFVPEMKFACLRGKGDPNQPFFQDYINALYAFSYSVRMSYKKGFRIPGYFEYTVYPLEGLWDLSGEAKENPGLAGKAEYVFNLMIRQPDFLTSEWFEKILESTKNEKPGPQIGNIEFKAMSEGNCIQMLHMGSYDSESFTFNMMEEFAAQNNWFRTLKSHREIYISDPRKVPPEQLKTVLRFEVHKKAE